MSKYRIRPDGKKDLLTLLREQGIALPAECGGKGICGKCRVNVDGREVLACRFVPTREVEVQTGLGTMAPGENAERDMRVELTGQSPVTAVGGKPAAFCVDLGTTTIAAALLDEDGRILYEAGCANSQRRYGADVIARVEYALNGGSEELKTAVRQDVRQLQEICRQQVLSAPIGTAKDLPTVLCGNPAMEHLYYGWDVGGLAKAPYQAVCTDLVRQDHDVFLPGIGPFLGADLLAGAAVCGIGSGNDGRITAYVDLGTNGEMLLAGPAGIYACSTAAGPALEGAGIRCGMPAIPGAVFRVEIAGRFCHAEVLGEAGTVARGLCGSGVLSCMSGLLKNGIAAADGKLTEEYFADGYPLTKDVLFTQEDVRKVQTAKAAIRAGLQMLCQAYGIGENEIARLLVAGGFGRHIDPEDAFTIGLFPPELRGRVETVGNAALAGAIGYARGENGLATLNDLKKAVRPVELAGSADFQTAFLAALDFGETNRFKG